MNDPSRSSINSPASSPIKKTSTTSGNNAVKTPFGFDKINKTVSGNESVPPEGSPLKTRKKRKAPFPPYSLMIAKCFDFKQEKLKLQDIFKRLKERFNQYLPQTTDWKNSVLHTLSINKTQFHKTSGDKGAGGFWFTRRTLMIMRKPTCSANNNAD